MRTFLLACTVFASLTLAASDAAACDFANYLRHEIAADPDDDVAPGRPRIESIAVRRGEHEADGFSCEPLGTITFRIAASDDRTASKDIGYRLTLDGGELPAGLTIPDEPIAADQDGNVYWSWSDADFEYPLDFAIRIAAVDAAGNTGPASEPITIAAAGNDAGCRAGGPSSTGGALAIGILAAAFAFRRRRHSARV